MLLPRFMWRESRTISAKPRSLLARASTAAVPHRLLQTLKSESRLLKIIAEFKRKSPSAGILRDDLSPEEVARRYERGGACAISVLTDEAYFGASIADLRIVRSTTTLPILRKDFIIDPIQVYEGAIAGADAVLLIAGALDDAALSEMRALAEDQLGFDGFLMGETLMRASDAEKALRDLISETENQEVLK